MPDLHAATQVREASTPLRMTTRQKQIMILLLGAQFMLAADFSILTVALPVIGDTLGFTFSNLQWITTGFALPAAGLTLLFGRAADLAGKRRLFLVGIGLLAVASLVGSMATGPAVLIGARVAQGVATAITVPSAMSLLTTTFPEGPLRRRALGINGALLGGGFTAGALLGGLLTGLLSWRWSFLINVPIAVLIFFGAFALISSDTRERLTSKLDVPGAAAVSGGLLALVYGVTTAGHAGWGDPVALFCLAAAVALLVAFWFIELRSPNPLVPVRVLKMRTVGWANFGGFIAIAMACGISFLMTLYMQKVLGFSAVVAGVVLGTPGLLTIVGGMVAPRFIGRFGGPKTLSLSLLVQSVAFALLLLLGEDPASYLVVLAILTVGFFAHAFSLVSYMITATSGLPNHEQGLATGLTTMSMQIGITLGIPVVSAIAAARTGALSGTTTEKAATLGGLHAGTLAVVLIMLASSAVIWAFLRRSNNSNQAA